ncbi:hypothetical protein [Burkholderia plantarii]|uniref:hypothetical protein n=1 Tax=Burkholderia plantarii TaxID=41899 RepID=UPI001F5B9887|nr:hypothetical protein [Burkholderia plantarii]
MAGATAGNPSASQGGLITFDCDYQPAGDAIRTRPALVQNVNITNVKASNVTLGAATGSCFQAIVAQGPVRSTTTARADAGGSRHHGRDDLELRLRHADRRGPASATTPGPIYAWNVNGIALQNVTIAGQLVNTTITDVR